PDAGSDEDRPCRQSVQMYGLLGDLPIDRGDSDDEKKKPRRAQSTRRLSSLDICRKKSQRSQKTQRAASVMYADSASKTNPPGPVRGKASGNCVTAGCAPFCISGWYAAGSQAAERSIREDHRCGDRGASRTWTGA